VPDNPLNAEPPQPSPQPAPGGRPEKRRPRWFRWVLGLVVLAIVAFFIFHHPGKPKPKPPPPIAITTTNALTGDIGISVTALGSVTPVYTVTLSSRVDGQLVHVNYVEGQMVRTNDLLVEIDSNPYQAQLAAAQGQYERDKALLAGAQIDLERFKAAYAKRAIPKQQYDDQLALVNQDTGTVKFDEGQIAAAQVNVDYCRIAAPISGRVGLRLVDPGNVVHAADTNALVVITQIQPMTVIFNVAEDYLPQIQTQMREGTSMTVEVFDRTQEKKIATGTFLTLDNQIDSTTGTVRIKALFTNDDEALFPNQFVNAKLVIQILHGVTLLPSAAIQRNPQGAFVYLVQTNQTLTMRAVTITATDNNESAVEGIKPGEVIATDNFNRLQEGIKVAPVEPARGGKQRGGS
jgi:multidrug efflux system membrane fusion protein